jgi:hypothetical protein
MPFFGRFAISDSDERLMFNKRRIHAAFLRHVSRPRLRLDIFFMLKYPTDLLGLQLGYCRATKLNIRLHVVLSVSCIHSILSAAAHAMLHRRPC